MRIITTEITLTCLKSGEEISISECWGGCKYYVEDEILHVYCEYDESEEYLKKNRACDSDE